MNFIKKTYIKENGFEQAEYDFTPILSGIEAFEIMIQWLNKYCENNYDVELGELIGRLFFIEGGFVDRAECLELFEKLTEEKIKERETRK